MLLLLWLQVHISKQRTHILTPSRKRMGKAVARKSHRTVAEEYWKSPNISKYLMHQLGTMLCQELKMMCSDSTQSVLQTQSLSDNPTFSWSTIYSELQLHAPLLFNLLSSLTRTRQVRSNQKAVMCVCAAVLQIQISTNEFVAESCFSDIICWSCIQAGNCF